MNPQPFEKKRWEPGYAEVICVVIVLTVLLTVLIPAVLGVLYAHSKSVNKAKAVDIKMAISAYMMDYRTLPVPKKGILLPSGDMALGGATGTDPSLPPLPGTDQLFQALTGNLNSYDQKLTSSSATGVNPRNVPYITLQKSWVDANGILLQDRWYSPSPSYFGIELDANHDGKLSNLPDPIHQNFKLTIKDSCALWGTNGRDYTKPDVGWITTY